MAIIDYMRKAGKFDDATVNEITYRVGDAVRKAGALLENIAPPQGRPTKKSRTDSGFYDDTLKEANMGDDTALNWRAASKLGAEKYSKYLVKLIEQRRFVLWWDSQEKDKGGRPSGNR